MTNGSTDEGQRPPSDAASRVTGGVSSSVPPMGPPMRGGPGGGGMRPAEAQALLHINKTFSALAIPAYRLLWLSMLLSFSGMQMQMIARGVLAYQIGGTAGSIAIVSLGWALPMLFFSLVGGTMADRMSKQKLMVLSQVTTSLIALTIAVLVHTGYIQLIHLFVGGLVQGTVFAFSGPSRSAFIPELVGDDELLNAIALNSAGMNLTRIGAPMLAGSLIAVPFIDIQGVYYIQAVLNIVAAVMVLMIRKPADATTTLGVDPGNTASRRYGAPKRETGVMRDLVDGVRYVVGSPILLTLMAMGFLPTLLGMSYQSFLPIFAKDVFGDGIDRNSAGLGLLTTMTGIGALTGSLIVASQQDFPKRAQLQLIGGLMFGLTLALFAIQLNLTLACVSLLAVGLSSAYFQALNSTMVMTASDPQYYGRVMSVNMMTFSLMPLGTLPMGFLADAIGSADLGMVTLIGVQVVNLGAGIVIAAFILMVTVFNPAYRKLEQDDLKRFAVIAADRLGEDQEKSAWQQIRGAFRHERGVQVGRKLPEEEVGAPRHPVSGG